MACDCWPMCWPASQEVHTPVVYWKQPCYWSVITGRPQSYCLVWFVGVMVSVIVRFRCWCRPSLNGMLWLLVGLSLSMGRDAGQMDPGSSKVSSELRWANRNSSDLDDEFRIGVGETLKLVLVQIHDEELVSGRQLHHHLGKLPVEVANVTARFLPQTEKERECEWICTALKHLGRRLTTREAKRWRAEKEVSEVNCFSTLERPFHNLPRWDSHCFASHK